MLREKPGTKVPATFTQQFMRVQFLPAAEQTVHFDEFQFDGRRRVRAVSAETGISFQDYGRMHVSQRAEQRASRWRPPYIFSNQQLQRVLIAAAWQFVHYAVPCPEDLSLAEAIRITDEKLTQMRSRDISQLPPAQQAIVMQHRATYEQAGPGAHLKIHAAMLWRSYRLGQESTVVAAALGMTPWAVRRNLAKLKKLARKLGFEVGPAPAPGSARGRASRCPTGRKLIWSCKRMGIGWTAERYGVAVYTVRKRLKQARRAARRSYKRSLTS